METQGGSDYRTRGEIQVGKFLDLWTALRALKQSFHGICTACVDKQPAPKSGIYVGVEPGASLLRVADAIQTYQ
jgi:hypothetical protein